MQRFQFWTEVQSSVILALFIYCVIFYCVYLYFQFILILV